MREEYVQAFTVDYISEARGPPGNRFYHVHWTGRNESNVTVQGVKPGDKWLSTWEPERFLMDAPIAVENFWINSSDSMQDTLESPCEHRCPHSAFGLHIAVNYNHAVSTWGRSPAIFGRRPVSLLNRAHFARLHMSLHTSGPVRAPLRHGHLKKIRRP